MRFTVKDQQSARAYEKHLKGCYRHNQCLYEGRLKDNFVKLNIDVHIFFIDFPQIGKWSEPYSYNVKKSFNVPQITAPIEQPLNLNFCNQQKYQTFPGKIYSLNHPDPFPGYAHSCEWNLLSPTNTRIVLDFANYLPGDLVGIDSDCQLENISVFLDGVLLHKICSSDMVGENIVLPVNKAKIVFKTKEKASNQHQGFALFWSYVQIADEELNHCASRSTRSIDAGIGKIISSNTNNGYPSNQICAWHFIVPPNQKEEIKVVWWHHHLI